VKQFTITTAAQMVGVSTSTLRRWQRDGLVGFTPGRDPIGRRVYDEQQLDELRTVFAGLHAEERSPAAG